MYNAPGPSAFGRLMTTLAAIDAGSNAMRLVIGRIGRDGGVEVVKNTREAVRLGKDVFAKGRMSRKLMKSATGAFRRFHETMNEWDVEHTVAVGTSALREAENRDELLYRIHRKTGIEVHVIDGLEEARLVHLAVSRKIDISEGDAVLVDIGGGSVEVTLTSNGALVESRTLRVGTVRMLQVLSEPARGFSDFMGQIEEIKRETRDWTTDSLGHHLVGRLVGTGGNVESIADLTGRRAGRKATSYASSGDLQRIQAQLEALSLEERQRELRLRPDRADVIYPAVIVVQALMNTVWASNLAIPRVGLKDGVLLDLAGRLGLARSGTLTYL